MDKLRIGIIGCGRIAVMLLVSTDKPETAEPVVRCGEKR